MPDLTQLWPFKYAYAFFLPILILAAVQIWAGYGLTQGREAARKALVVLASILIAWQLVGAALVVPMMRQMQSQMGAQLGGGGDPAFHSMMRAMLPMQMAMSFFMALVVITVLIFFIRWLGSPKVREACGEVGPFLPPVPSGGKP
jgi:uncharacterized membrane protein